VGVAQARKGVMEAWTLIPGTRDWRYINSQRVGKLLSAK
jgi:hypothetical protein